MGFMKRLFGGDEPAAPAAVTPTSEPVPASPQAEADLRAAMAAVDEARAASRLIRRARDPLEWAESRQILGNALIHLAGMQSDAIAVDTYEEAESVLGEAIETAGPDAHPAFLASMGNLHGYAAYCRGDRLAGDAKRRAYAAAAARFMEAMDKISPDTQRPLWVDLGFYRGATLQALALLEDNRAGAVALDQAAATFRAIAEHGTGDSTVHPIAAYNLHVVLENRARLARGSAALPYLTESRNALLQAMADPVLAASKADHESRLAALDAAIGAARD